MPNPAALFRFRVDVSEIAAKLNTARELIEDQVIQQVELLSIASHGYIMGLAKKEWANDDFKRNYYLGIGQKDASGVSSSNPAIDQTAKYLRWVKITDGIWVVELDERARWLEEGRAETFMGDWLLKPGAKGVKRAKDGSLYRAIPFKETSGKKDTASHPALSQIVRDYAAAQQPKINLNKIEKNADKTHKLGMIKKLDIRPHDATGYAPGVIFSRPRTEAEAKLTGLKAHSGIFKLAGAAVFQNVYDKGNLVTDPAKAKKIAATKKGSVKKEVVVFRVISTKHKAEGRWMYPEVKPVNFLQKAYDHATEQWDQIVKSIEQTLGE